MARVVAVTLAAFVGAFVGAFTGLALVATVYDVRLTEPGVLDPLLAPYKPTETRKSRSRKDTPHA